MIRVFLAAVLLWTLPPCAAHEGGKKDTKPTKARADLKRSRDKLAAAKRKIAGQGRYSCCVKPSCDLCARVNGSCACGRNVAAGRGACGECLGGWMAGRGNVKGVSAKSIKLLTAEHQACALAPGVEGSAELREAIDALMGAKRTLMSEKRFSCCIREGCGQCAHEANCPCGTDLAAGRGGVCGDCLDGWRSGKGGFAGIDPAEVTLAPMEAMAEFMGPGGGGANGVYSSGTSQVPRSAPMEMLHWRPGTWQLAMGGEAFLVYDAQSGPRGRDKTFSTNWLMGMASRRLGPGALTFRSMLSLEPATITSRRYPLLFATGETAYGIPIINGQHPHNFLMELAASYEIRLGERTSLNLYGGPRGEPALGPPAFPHRVSASENPIAVISHHLQDSTHISNSVITAGITHRFVTWEVSGFHGREPSEERWGLERGAPNSLSTRLTITPTPRWSGQFSIGRINQREATHPLRPAFRTTASVTYVRPLGKGHWASSAVWGRNHDLAYTQLPNIPIAPKLAARADAKDSVREGLIETSDFRGGLIRPLHIVSVPTRIPGQIYNSYLIETTVKWGNHWIWGRAENADKDSTLLYEEAPFVLLVDEQRYARVQAYTAGYERELPAVTKWLTTGIGGQVMIFHAPPALSPVYGSHPLGVQIFLRVRLRSKGP